MRTPEVVYFLSCANVQRVKIGTTGYAVTDRIREIRNQNPYPLILVAEVVGSVFVERFFHARFANYRLHGEWFRVAPMLIDAICTIRAYGRGYGAEVAPFEFAADGYRWTVNGPEELSRDEHQLARERLQQRKEKHAS